MQRDRFDRLPHFVVATLDRSTIHTEPRSVGVRQIHSYRMPITPSEAWFGRRCRTSRRDRAGQSAPEAERRRFRRQHGEPSAPSNPRRDMGDAGERDASRFLKGVFARRTSVGAV